MQASEVSPLTLPAAPQGRHWRSIALALGAVAAASAALVSVFAAAPFTPEAGLTGWVGRPALTSNNLTSGSERIFRANYRRSDGTGRVTANAIDANGTISSTSVWTGGDTAEQLESLHWSSGRKIVTFSGGTGVAFRFGNLSASQKTDIASANVLNYVRGDRSNEAPNGQKYRPRFRVQGPIQHSPLLYWRHNDGSTRLYVGGNDGMLHVFNASTGAEVFAYVPSMLIPKLPALTAFPYAPTQLVDGGLVLADVAQSDGTSATLLAGALGGGGKGLYMLDVTSPSPASEADAAKLIKWEVTPTNTGFANLGFTYAAPRLARLNSGTAAVVVGNGYGNQGSGTATLLLINADTGAVIREINTNSGSTASPNGLSTPTLLDVNRDGRVDYAYAGDLDGNLWRFDLTGDDPSNYSVTKLMTTDGNRPITSAPVVTPHPVSGHLVAFGTGRLLTAADASDTTVQYVYGLWDGAPSTNTAWLGQTLSEVTVNGKRMRTLSANTPDWTSGKNKGWRLTLTAGERVVGEGPMLNDGRLYLTTGNPTVAAPSEEAPAGETWLTEVNVLTGGSPAAPIYDVNADGKIDSSDNHDGSILAGVFVGNGITSQAVLVDKASFSMTLFNRQSDYDDTPPPPDPEVITVIGRGVSAGHFDVDVFGWELKGGTREYKKFKHMHEYDDLYDVTGVNLLNASCCSENDGGPVYNLATRLPSSTDEFKVLLINQYLNPAVVMKVGSPDYVSVKTYGEQTTLTTAKDVLDKAPTYTLSNINYLTAKLPIDAFKTRDWWGNGDERAGLIPTETGCVSPVKSDGGEKFPGPNGERKNGAFTVQIIRSTTPADALELNHNGGDTKYGWRVKASEFTNHVLVEYTFFWHHPRKACYHHSDWIPNPPEDTTINNKTETKRPGSADPTKDDTGGEEHLTITIINWVTVTGTDITGNFVTTTTTITYSDGKTHTTVIKDNGDGTETVTVTTRDGVKTEVTRAGSGYLKSAPDELLKKSGRINWREIFRE